MGRVREHKLRTQTSEIKTGGQPPGYERLDKRGRLPKRGVAEFGITGKLYRMGV